MSNVIETRTLGKSYGQTKALHDCTLAIPEGHVVALVGPNGAGKTTLLNLAVGLAIPTSGEVTVLGGRPAGSPAALDGIGFVAQNTPLYKNLSAADLIHETRNLNRHFDHAYAKQRLDQLGIPLRQKAGKMSGGQEAQLALTLALARRPQLLVLDEPMASLDPLARIDFMATVMAAVADDGLSVVLSSHILADLERVCDYLVLLSRGRVQVVGEVDDLLAHHRTLTGPVAEYERYAKNWNVVHASHDASRVYLRVRSDGTSDPVPPGWEARPITLEELNIAYLREPEAAALPGPRRIGGSERSEFAK
jgi:ABC-2 type transport system ATP-binding protein